MNVEGTDMYPSSEGRRAAARETTELLQDKDILLQEMQHRFSQWAGDRFERDRYASSWITRRALTVRGHHSKFSYVPSESERIDLK